MRTQINVGRDIKGKRDRLWAFWDEKCRCNDGEREGSRGPVTGHRKKGRGGKKCAECE